MRRRKVWRVAAGYGVGWLIIQFATTVLPVLTLPIWTARLVIVLILAGFPIALVLAWAFDVTSHGIEKTPDRSLQSPSGLTINELLLDPVWDPLRRDPRFQQMLTKFGNKSK